MSARVFVGAFCRCGSAFVLASSPANDTPVLHCTLTCAKRARRHVAAARPCVGCGNARPNRRALCWECNAPLRAACYGKQRLDAGVAKSISRRRGDLSAYPCPVCDTWHNGRGDPPEELGRIVAAIRAAGRDDLLRTRAAGWAPSLVQRRKAVS